MRKSKKIEQQIVLLNQDKSSNKPVRPKKDKLAFLNRSLLLKQTLVSAWKTKLQLVILLLLTTFATSLVTGSWISYQRVQQGGIFLELDKANYDAILPYNGASNSTQIANEAFSLRIGRLYYPDESAVYFDNSIIGQEINPLSSGDLKIEYTRDNNSGWITGVKTFAWGNPNKPLTFNRGNRYVRASVYGQLLAKAEQAQQTNNTKLANHYQTAAQELYKNVFVNFSAGQILESLKVYFVDWIEANVNDEQVKLADDDEFTNYLVNNRINYHNTGAGDFRIPDSVNVAEDITDPNGVLATRLLKMEDPNPRLAASNDLTNYGMNGQWMAIYRNFDITPTPTREVLGNFSQSYKAPISNYNNMTDGSDPNMYSYHFAQAAAALQNRNINVVNQFVYSAGVDETTGQTVSVKVINLGIKSTHNSVNLKIFEGLYPSNKNEIVISPQYARQKGIKPGDSIDINNQVYMVSGIGGDAYNIYPTINILDPVPNTRSEFLAYVLPNTFHSGVWNSNDKTDISLMYFLPWSDVAADAFDTQYFSDYFQRTLFNGNKLGDRNQYDYSQYLIEKYVNNNPDYQSKYQLEFSLVIDKNNSQFSSYNRGLSLLSSTLAGFKYAAIAGVVFLVIIVIFITYLIIKKAIQKDQVSMGILKSAGYSTSKILVSYIAYPLLVALFAIPIGWLFGLVFQVYFTELFNTIFILPYNVFSFNIIPLFIALALIGGFVLITTLISGYRLLQKESLSLVKNDSDIVIGGSYIHKHAKPSPKLGFKGRFLLSLSRTNWKKITITAVVISIATLAITATISVPATISGMKDNYFKTQKYKNYYQYQSPIPNMPLSKYGLYAWNNLDNSNNDLYYPVASTMPWPEDIIINDSSGKKLAWYNPLEYDKSLNNFDSILHSAAGLDPTVRAQIIQQVGSYLNSLTNGPLDLNYLSWSYSWLGARGFSNALLNDIGELDKSLNKNFSTSLINFASTLLPSLLNVTNPGVPPGPDAIKEILKLTLPGFIRQVLDRQGPNAYDYFSIGHSTVAYNPLYNSEIDGPQEELVTQLQLGSSDSKLNNEFLNVSGIDPDTKMLVMNSNLVQNLRYSSSDNVIPMVINQSFAAKYDLKAGQTINAAPNVRTLYYRSTDGTLKPIPKENWYYGPNPLDQEDKNSVWNAQASRWSYRGQKPIGNTDFSDSYGYSYDGFYDSEGKPIIKDEPDAWNNVENIWLNLPADIDTKAKSGSLRTHNTSDNLEFNIENIAYKDSTGTHLDWINPFSYRIANDFKDNPINPTNLLTARIPEWYGAMLDKDILVSDSSLHLGSLKAEIDTKFLDWWQSVVGNTTPIKQYRIIGIQRSYDTPRAYIDQKWANLISGYSYYGERSEQLKDPVYDNGIYQWFSGKLSTADNIYDIIGRMSFKRSADDYTMYSMSSLKGNNEEPLIANSDLLTRKREMLDKMASIALLASVLFIVTTILCSILIVIMITDSFLEQFRKFMSQMKAEGYTNQEINSFTLGIFTPWVFLGYAVGYGLGYLLVWGFTKLVSSLAGLALPFTFIWWIIPISLGIIVLIYFSTFIINTIQLNKMNLITLLQTN